MEGTERLRLAVQKTGRLSEKSLEIIAGCGISFGSDSRLLKEHARNFPLEFLFVRDDDIPAYVRDGVADIGIVGRNELDERCPDDLEIVRDLGFAQCRLSVAVPRDFPYGGLQWLAGKRIATSYPNILGRILEERGVTAKICYLSGSVEIAPAAGIADAICDLVSSGTTLLMNGLREVEPLYSSTAVMVSRQGFMSEASPRQVILERLLLRIDSVIRAKSYKYIMFNLPADHVTAVSKIAGGMKSPTVTPLLEEGWVSVQMVVAEDTFWDIFEKLRELGAQGILVTPIEKLTE
ncbi:ATP phosphoribosyltransferase [Parasphaerochaeta coccoides]|uniref:ATP phosphoribosyltransferase n=1 Tax=Parasphaerochaeta coccoides (strain ATCC BAA-1237 / DSM 17374 / SPN1) TaxID=760011 RepID=F4GI33_PARC1|nr:ATP phosphoribosyltransferase [Parasphaerochaeta coccoides]AEC02631.1 ATP phosphoribosyltransferase [Parasphaerochaeta coccoides DSM 17374]